ncbi:MAG: hypothetical protein GC179_15530 [Anaerolineaceae bacterium]|nr:hypothetical protein [Anaerolineaceae bacterium]
MRKVPSNEYRVLSLKQKFTIVVVGVSCLISGCNLQQTPLDPTPTLQATPTALDQPTEQPTRTPIANQSVPSTQPSLVAPPGVILDTPTALPLGASPNAVTSGTVIPTVSTQQAVKSTTIQASGGKTVGLSYVVTMTSGSVTLTMQGPAGAVWQKTFTASETGRIEVTIPQSGAYDVMAQTDRFEGNYQLAWD